MPQHPAKIGTPQGAAGAVSHRPKIMDLPVPRKTGGMPLFSALGQRHSTREYSDRPIARQLLSDLLWAAFGISRPSGDRTAPY
jgi:hypothetical protein